MDFEKALAHVLAEVKFSAYREAAKAGPPLHREGWEGRLTGEPYWGSDQEKLWSVVGSGIPQIL